MDFKKLIVLLVAIALCKSAMSQVASSKDGVIVYEKSINVYSFFKNLGKPESELYKPGNDNQFYKSNYKLVYDDSRSLYYPIDRAPTDDINISVLTMVGMDNKVYKDFNENMMFSEKKGLTGTVNYVTKIPDIKWKLTDEEREIAGYTCRRANGLMLDSIYVVAFYSSEFDIQGGPESFSGLPGMILGVALPHQNVTWFATEISNDVASGEIPIVPPKKGKKITHDKFVEDVLKSKDMLVPWAITMLLL
ncbi:MULTISPECIES: GLPGLI family protein [Sphingobacterium]|uniref:GLPGLI family protein n=1 Tax=Sphingobacterium populi TaxID=1812824 RepID=A0ABW5UCL9_9SPHI|nr:GLPGLI family protein [Sphingobacterium sp. CFCC 11742]